MCLRPFRHRWRERAAGSVVEWNRLKVGLGDPLGAVDDRVGRGAADKEDKTADHAVGAPGEVLAVTERRALRVSVQPHGLLKGGDQGSPVRPLDRGSVGERASGDGGEPAGDLLAPGAGE